MKLQIVRTEYDGTPSEAILTHKTETLSFNIALFDRTSYSGGYDIFEEINGFWANSQESTQDNIFSIYKKIRELFDTVWEIDKLTLTLYRLVEELFIFHPIEDIHHWVWFYGNVHLPLGLRDAFTDSYEMPGTRERTYLKEDYRWLVSLSVSLRLMIPIWGEFVSRTKKNNTVFKEYYAFQLLAQANLIRSEPMERLRIYVDHSLPQEKSKSSAIFGGVSSVDFPLWILALVAIRRLSIGDVRGGDGTSSLVTFIYKFIGQKVKGHDKSFNGLIKDKVSEGQAVDGENNLSKLEGYKIKQEIAAGDIAVISYFLKSQMEIATAICPTIDPKLVYDSLRSVRALENKQIWKPQHIVTQWVLKKVIPPMGLLHVSKHQVLDAMGITQALLWHRGFYEIAALVTAINQENIEELSICGCDSRARITKDQLEELDLLYPYTRKPVGKQRVVKHINVAVEAIESVVNMFSEHDWILTLPDYMLEKIEDSGSRYSTPHNAKILLANLTIELAKRTFK